MRSFHYVCAELRESNFGLLLYLHVKVSIPAASSVPIRSFIRLHLCDVHRDNKERDILYRSLMCTSILIMHPFPILHGRYYWWGVALLQSPQHILVLHPVPPFQGSKVEKVYFVWIEDTYHERVWNRL